MTVNIDELIETITDERMDNETTYTRDEARELGIEWSKEQSDTVLKEAEKEMRAARLAYFQAIREYEQAYGKAATKLSKLESAINKCWYKSDNPSMNWVPVRPLATFGGTKMSLKEVTRNQVDNSWLHARREK